VNFFTGPNVTLHHIAFELKDFMHLQNSCEVMGQKQIPIIWGPLRHGPGHNVATYHRNQDEQVVEFFCELDQMKDEELGYSSRARGIATRRSGPSGGPRARPASGVRHPRTISTARRCDARADL
jgi:hypothetical protein